MERYTRRIYVRVTDADLARAKALAEGPGLSVSDLVRLLLRLPAGVASPETHIRPHLLCRPPLFSSMSVLPRPIHLRLRR